MCPRLAIEAVVAAGPRKSAEKYRGGAPELCEDCAGYQTLGDYVLFWLTDGTSNCPELPGRGDCPGFSVRILAQDLGDGFAGLAGDMLIKNGRVRPDLHKTLLRDIAAAWQRRLEDYLADVSRSGSLPAFLDRVPRMGDNSYRLTWSSTLLGGVYNAQYRCLDLLNIGTSAALVIGKDARQVPPQRGCEILIATISHENELKIEVRPIEVEASWHHFDEVTGFLALTDGMANDLDTLLDQLGESLAKRPLADVRREPWIQLASATFNLKAAISSAMVSAGVFHPSVLRGRPFMSRATSLSQV